MRISGEENLIFSNQWPNDDNDDNSNNTTINVNNNDDEDDVDDDQHVDDQQHESDKESIGTKESVTSASSKEWRKLISLKRKFKVWSMYMHAFYYMKFLNNLHIVLFMG